MTQTVQPRAGKDLIINNFETEDNMKLLLKVCDNLNELYGKLTKLSYVLGKSIMEHNLSYQDKK